MDTNEMSLGGYKPASNSNLRLRMFIKNFTTASIGAKASEKSKKPIIIGCSLWKPNDWYKEWLLMKTENREKM